MSAHINGRKVKGAYINGKEVKQIYDNGKLVWYKYYPSGYEIVINIDSIVEDYELKGKDLLHAEFLQDDIGDRYALWIGIHLNTSIVNNLDPKGHVKFSYKRPNGLWENAKGSIPISMITKPSYTWYEPDDYLRSFDDILLISLISGEGGSENNLVIQNPYYDGTESVTAGNYQVKLTVV